MDQTLAAAIEGVLGLLIAAAMGLLPGAAYELRHLACIGARELV